MTRPICARCRRPTSVCYCAALPRLATTTRVVILQHPRERHTAIGTARMASLCLDGAELHVGMRWGASELAHALGDPARPPILLYPGPGARDILRDPPAGPVTLIVVDGTWSQARTLVRDNPVLHGIPRYAFATPEPSQYRIRREPRPEYVSTIEALMHVLGVLEGDPPKFRSLLAPLRAMVDAQLACQATAPRRTSYRRPAGPRPQSTIGAPQATRKLPAAIADRFGDLVCVVGEANAWPYRADAARPDELVHWVAHRPGTGETFDVIAAPGAALSPSTTAHTGLDEARLRGGVARAELVEQFSRFLRPTDILCAWGGYSASLLRASGGPLPAERIDVRAAAQRLTNRKVGSLEDFATTIAPTPAPIAAGRAGRRLAMIVQIVEAWRAVP